MAIQYSDSYGSVLDTGINTAVTPRLNTEVETHLASEIDTGIVIPAGKTIVTVTSRGSAHRGKDSPR